MQNITIITHSCFKKKRKEKENWTESQQAAIEGAWLPTVQYPSKQLVAFRLLSLFEEQISWFARRHERTERTKDSEIHDCVWLY